MFLEGFVSPSNDPLYAYYDARSYAGLGKKELTLRALERSVETKAFHTAFVKVDPVFDPIRDEERYKLVLGKMNLLDTNN